MEIERINENTVKFYISYLDIEERGFDRDEIWYNRDRSEELFWEMMDEIHHEEEFAIEGPLWIQVQALDKGLEIMVTKAQFAKDGQRLEIPLGQDGIQELPVDENLESFLDEHFQGKTDGSEVDAIHYNLDILEFTIVFDDFEDVISLSKRNGLYGFQSSLYYFEKKYYLYVVFNEEEIEAEENVDNVLSLLLEYGNESSVTIHRLQEYGKEIVKEDVFETVQTYFA
ncbi:adaptor protein MecA [Bacillus sp. AGMB 02131]|uniref:Adapter protein MecA n=1 Tax=Peribacillus faecalis TaxID=2772559 RepID=A0A927HD60_9BACI|nr:adaptor protein MecA [Peribacillus faecalis]MBD3110347.1 adaptor protein MecA [Peribacillus faecalis]